MNEEEKKAIKYFYNLRATIDESNMLFDEDINVKCGKETIKQITAVLNLLEKKDKQIEELKEIDEKRTWTVNNVIAEYIPDYELISLVNRYKDESFIPRVEVEKILNDRKK